MEPITHQIRCQQWARIIQECMESGLSKTEWCRQNGISDKKFFYWQKILRREAYDLAANTDQPGTLVPVSAQPPATPFVEVKLDPPVQQPTVTSGFHPDAVIQANGFAIGLSNSASEELIRSLGGLLHV